MTLESEPEVLWEDDEFVLSRVRPSADHGPTLLVRPVAARPAEASIERLEHAHALRAELESSWAARPTDLIGTRARLALRLEDPGGQVLATLVGQPWDVHPFLQAAVALTCALGGLHRRGLVHRDVKPANILLDVATAKAWLAGFGLVTRLGRERRMPGASQEVVGTFAYMAPEQSGRMNRSVDARSDLYSLGVTLYEMLTGTRPFKADEPMEWIHCHIARQPVPPGDRVLGIPDVVSAIVLKLLAKNPEDRYQTARGVEADLRRCLTDWSAAGRIERFPLAVRDVPDHLLIPERLYGRGREIVGLVDAFARVARDGRQVFVLLSGYSGVGKSSIVNELQQVVVGRHGFFVSGKFEPHERDVPFAPIVRAFRDLVRSVLLSSDADLRQWREAIRLALGVNAQLVIDLIPDVKLVIGPQEPVADLPPQQAQVRFQRVLQQFVAVFAQSEHPLVLFVDDLQWLDRASLDLLRNLATHDEGMHLLLVGAYRDNEVGPAHPLSDTLAAIRGAAIVRELRVSPLDRDDVRALIADALRRGAEDAEPLAEIVYEKTAGNPFFLIQFLHELAEKGDLAFDALAGAWTWDMAHIQAKGYTENVLDLLAGKLDRLSPTTQATLRDLACLSVGRTNALSIVQGCSDVELHAMLRPAAEAGFVSRGTDSYAFCHDRIREAAYALVPESERAAAHLRIGRLLLDNLPMSDPSDVVFDVVNQLNLGAALVTEADERRRVAELNLVAGRRARASSAYKSALVHLAAGEALLPEEDWDRHHELRFALALHRAECEFLTGDLPAAEARLARLRERTADRMELTAVASLRIAVYTTQDRTDLAIEVGLEQLRTFGIAWSAHPGEEEIRAEYDLLRQRLGKHAIDTLVDLVSTRGTDLLAIMDILRDMLPAAVFVDKNLHDLAVLRMANLSLEHGHCDGSPLAFAQLSMVIGPRFGHHQDGFRFGHLGMALAERGDLARVRGKVYTVVGYHVLPWTGPLRAALSVMQRALDLARETGDLLFAAFSRTHVISLRLAAGDPLEEVQAEAERHLASCRRANFGLLVYCLLGQLDLVRALRGHSVTGAGQDAPATLSETSVESLLDQDGRLAIAACWYWIRKLQARFHSGYYMSALEMATKAERLLWTSPTFFERAEYHLYSALAHAKAWDAGPETDAAGHREALAGHHAQLADWAATCAETFGSRAALAGAELARVENRGPDAERLYEDAMRSAATSDAPHIEAMASELAAHFLRARGLDGIARGYLGRAQSCYRRWGASAAARRLDAFYALSAEAPASHPTAVVPASAEGLDLATVIKASQTISGEILIDKLVEALMVTTIQHAGAERGLLIVQRNEETRVEAEATTQLDAIAVRLLGRTPAAADLPVTILTYVLRTREAVILDDGAVPNPFSADSYLVAHGVRSLLCLPLVKQGALVGVLYLENRVASHVFTPARIELLSLLASQAAISLDNARLYADLREAQAYLSEAQRLSTTGSFGWKPASGEIVWSEETHRIFDLDRGTRPTVEFAVSRAHPEDRDELRQAIDRAAREAQHLDHRYRLLTPDGAVKYLHVVAQPVRDTATGETEYVGAVMDVTAVQESRQALEKAFTEIETLKDQLQRENIVLREEVDKTSMFEEIVGASPPLRAVLSHLSRVAPLDSTVLISGETGTGKELIARAIHKRSLRSSRAFVSVNCAAIPSSLIASELFGHERGAFTGAVQRRQGRFELADGGTIFLDEVGELPAETQVMLLRVLQEREFERVGGSGPVRVDVRVIAATNRDLQIAVANGAFRADLFYRLNVFPLDVPPLRDRRSDIPLLVEYFIHRYARRAGKKIRSLQKETSDLLRSYDWPGNIRELQNLIERAVILSDGDTLSIDERWLSGQPAKAPVAAASPAGTLATHQRDAIEAALKESKGRVSGPFGAAARLGVPSSTLESKIKALKIDKQRFKA
jgi:transcriptional regulator with GAF, ATPase, and Fis domain/predicted ATPase